VFSSGRGTPDPIPNSAVKPASADGTWTLRPGRVSQRQRNAFFDYVKPASADGTVGHLRILCASLSHTLAEIIASLIDDATASPLRECNNFITNCEPNLRQIILDNLHITSRESKPTPRQSIEKKTAPHGGVFLFK